MFFWFGLESDKPRPEDDAPWSYKVFIETIQQPFSPSVSHVAMLGHCVEGSSNQGFGDYIESVKIESSGVPSTGHMDLTLIQNGRKQVDIVSI